MRAGVVLEETGLLPHLNPGAMTRADLAALRPVSASHGDHARDDRRAAARSGAGALGAPDKDPAAAARDDPARRRAGDPVHERDPDRHRRDAARSASTRCWRSRELARRARPPPGGHRPELQGQARHAHGAHPEPDMEDHLWTIAAARLLLPASVHVQAPPNLAFEDFRGCSTRGIDDWGGVSPVTPDHVNPEAPWPDLDALAAATPRARADARPAAAALPGARARPRALGSTPPWRLRCAARRTRWGSRARIRWAPGETAALPAWSARAARLERREHERCELDGAARARVRASRRSARPARRSRALPRGRGPRRGRRGCPPPRPRGRPQGGSCARPTSCGARSCGDEVTYVVTRNIQYTNVCYFRCGFCAFSKGRLAADLRGKPYLVPMDEIVRRAQEAWDRGAVEVCLQGGIHPGFDGDVLRRASSRRSATACPASTCTPSRRSRSGRARPRSACRSRTTSRVCGISGLSSLPGTAAEILDDEVRAGPLPRQDRHGAVARGPRHRAPRRPALERDDDVRTRRAARATGPGT